MANPFQTPVNEQSFSGLIDAAILATGKPMQLTAAVQFANLVVRECQSLGLFAQDMIEETQTVTAVPFTWTRPALFRSLRTVKYPGCDRYPELALPGRKQRGKCDYFYAADDYFVFSGVALSDIISFATYYFRKPLGYYSRINISTAQYPGGPYPTRPAYLDLDTGLWMYLNAGSTAYVTTLGDPTTEAARRIQASNWLISNWYDLILSGTKSKIWSSSGDPRGPIEYSVYKQNQTLLRNTVSYEGEGF